MIEDDLIREIRAAREEYCRQFNYDISAICRDLREQQRTGGRQVVSFPPRRPSRTSREKDSGSTAPATDSRRDDGR